MALRYGSDAARRVWEGMDALARVRFDKHRGIVGHRHPPEEEIRAAIRERTVELEPDKYENVEAVPASVGERGFHWTLASCFASLEQGVDAGTERPKLDYPHPRSRSLAWLKEQKRAAFERAWEAWQPGKPYPSW